MEIAEKLNAHEERAIPIQKISSKAVSLEEIFCIQSGRDIYID